MKNKFLLLSLVTLSSLFVGCNGTSSSMNSSSSDSTSSASSQSVKSASTSVNMKQHLINNLKKLHDQSEKNYTLKYDPGTNDKADVVYCTKNAIYRDANNPVDVMGYAEDETGVFSFKKVNGVLHKGGYLTDVTDNYIKDLYNYKVSLGAYQDKVAPRFDSLDVDKYSQDGILTSFGGRTMIETENNDLFYFVLCLGWDQTFNKTSTYAFVNATEDTISYEVRGGAGVVLTVTIYDIGSTTIEGSEKLFTK